MVFMSELLEFFFFSSRRRHTRWTGDWSSDVCSSDLIRSHAIRKGITTAPAAAREDERRLADEDDSLGAQIVFMDSLYGATRSEERRVGKECRSRWSPDH